MDLQDIKKNVEKMSDYQLKLNISEGRKAYQKGVFQLYIEEAEKRGVKTTKDAMDKIKEENREKGGLDIVKVGYGLGFLGGVGGYVVSAVILFRRVKSNDKNAYYPEEVRKHAKWIILFTTLMIVIGWRLIGFLLALFCQAIIR